MQLLKHFYYFPAVILPHLLMQKGSYCFSTLSMKNESSPGRQTQSNQSFSGSIKYSKNFSQCRDRIVRYFAFFAIKGMGKEADFWNFQQEKGFFYYYSLSSENYAQPFIFLFMLRYVDLININLQIPLQKIFHPLINYSLFRIKTRPRQFYYKYILMQQLSRQYGQISFSTQHEECHTHQENPKRKDQEILQHIDQIHEYSNQTNSIGKRIKNCAQSKQQTLEARIIELEDQLRKQKINSLQLHKRNQQLMDMLVSASQSNVKRNQLFIDQIQRKICNFKAIKDLTSSTLRPYNRTQQERQQKFSKIPDNDFNLSSMKNIPSVRRQSFFKTQRRTDKENLNNLNQNQPFTSAKFRNDSFRKDTYGDKDKKFQSSTSIFSQNLKKSNYSSFSSKGSYENFKTDASDTMNKINLYKDKLSHRTRENTFNSKKSAIKMF